MLLTVGGIWWWPVPLAEKGEQGKFKKWLTGPDCCVAKSRQRTTQPTVPVRDL